MRPGALVVSLAAGITTAFVEQRLPEGTPVVRVMPNTPALVDEGMAAISPGSHCDEAHLAEAEALLRSVGQVVRVPEKQQDAVTAISGSGPAYIFFVVEAMIEAGVHLGLPRATANELVVQTSVRRREDAARDRRAPDGAARERDLARPAPPSPRCASSRTTRSGPRSSSRWRRPGTGPARSPPARTDPTVPATFVWDERLAAYDFGPGHPLAPVRVELAVRLARDLGLLDADLVRETPADTATDDELCLVHDAEYVAVVRRPPTTRGPAPPTSATAWAPPDDPVFAGMHEASAHVVGAIAGGGARRCWRASREHAVNLAGGLHHAMPDSASGFCIYNDVGRRDRSGPWTHGVERVAYVDVDVHHGDGVERAFWDDPRVLTDLAARVGRAPSSPAPASRPTSAGTAPRAPRSTSRCRRAPATTGGCARSTPWSRPLLRSVPAGSCW